MGKIRGVRIGGAWSWFGIKCEILVEPRDLWTGLFWDVRGEKDDELHAYWCGMPGLVFHTWGKMPNGIEIPGDRAAEAPDKVEPPEVEEVEARDVIDRLSSIPEEAWVTPEEIPES